ncbi:hypothetical protein ACNQ05_25365, partial [Enterobacter cloacae complex sp.6701062]|uniref:hypothetical protein n=1 Tax=Enterobacter cloacae complex sp.6701062 TaxID=3397177 RepID=UPI003AAE8F9F
MSTTILAFIDIDQWLKILIGIASFGIGIVCYMVILVKGARLKSQTLEYEGTNILIQQGDIFSDEFLDDDTV